VGVHGKESIAIAAGDTYLFSPLIFANNTTTMWKERLVPHMKSYSAVTSPVPYFTILTGPGYEESYSRYMQVMQRNEQL
jgi:predicted phosphoadenosine phosphosulfate sulfurtransferase